MKLTKTFYNDKSRLLSVRWFHVSKNLLEREIKYPNPPPDLSHIGRITLIWDYSDLYISLRPNELNLNISSFGSGADELLEFLQEAELKDDGSGFKPDRLLSWFEISKIGIVPQYVTRTLAGMDEGDIDALTKFVIDREKFIAARQ